MDRGTTPIRYRAYFIEPGIISYEDIKAGKVLVKRPALDKMLSSFVGKPVFNVSHNDTQAKAAFDFSNMTEEEKDNLACGIISAVGTDKDSGWDFADMMIWDAATQNNLDKEGFTVSCAYIPTEVEGAGDYHGIAYDEEVMDGSYTHMAVVSNPRYEGAKVFRNSKEEDGNVKLFFTSDKKNAKKNADDEDDAKKKAEEKAKEDAKKNADDDGETMNAKDVYANIDGEKVPVSELVQSFMKGKKNADSETSKEVSDSDEVTLPDGSTCTVGDLKKAYQSSKKNSDVTLAPTGEDAEDVVDETKQRQNARKAEPNEYFVTIRENAQKDTASQVEVMTRADRLAAGKERYGTPIRNVKEAV